MQYIACAMNMGVRNLAEATELPTLSSGNLNSQNKVFVGAPVGKEYRKHDLCPRQKELLATLLEYGAISQAQHDQSLRDLTEKMVCNQAKNQTIDQTERHPVYYGGNGDAAL